MRSLIEGSRVEDSDSHMEDLSDEAVAAVNEAISTARQQVGHVLSAQHKRSAERGTLLLLVPVAYVISRAHKQHKEPKRAGSPTPTCCQHCICRQVRCST